jgi:S-adenosylmethionine decarboxylase
MQHPALLPLIPSGTRVPWGMLASIELRGCDRERLAAPLVMRRVVRMLIDAIGMRTNRELALERSGEGDLAGWSALQYIETNSISVQTDEVSGRCFVDIFCRRRFDAGRAAAIATEQFGGTAALTVL